MQFSFCPTCGKKLDHFSSNASSCPSCASSTNGVKNSGNDDGLQTVKLFNIYAWLMVLVPLSGMTIEYFFQIHLTFEYWIIWIILCILDAKQIRAAGYTPPSFVWVYLLPPVYLWKRARASNQGRKHFWIWCLSLLLASGLAYLQAKKHYLERTACNMVTQGLSEQTHTGRSCKSVILGKEVSTGNYQAKAVLDNNAELNITLELHRDGRIEMKIPPHQL
ncbi:hypothetical protein LIN78_07350 [Leeia sp. TBRC 13508]|uniref:Uncharacterized protein n=1 Tax=Leeia speluncae TaxID=2884804 RepID=A0ABS8D571_9NEIS|nr:hypothetical protein [Leeia speluncae]MCB6183359.1 hypothetical protein [Leeia speluncae]